MPSRLIHAEKFLPQTSDSLRVELHHGLFVSAPLQDLLISRQVSFPALGDVALPMIPEGIRCVSE